MLKLGCVVSVVLVIVPVKASVVESYDKTSRTTSW